MVQQNFKIKNGPASKPLVHWLLSGVSSLDQLKIASLASVRLRAAVAVQSCLCVGIHSTIGEVVPTRVTILVIGKIGANGIDLRSKRWLASIRVAKRNGAKVVVDYTDHHLAHPSPMRDFYMHALEHCDVAVVPSHAMRSNVQKYWAGDTYTIPDALEYGPQAPKPRLDDKPTALWFGHPSNLEFLVRFLRGANLENKLKALVICTDARGIQWVREHTGYFQNLSLALVPWSITVLPKIARQCDFALLPAGKTDSRKSGASENRLVTALALGLPVLAHSLPSYQPFRAYYSDLDEDDYMAIIMNPWGEHQLIRQAQYNIISQFSLEAVGAVWRNFVLAVIRQRGIVVPP
jgi:hypothetical protein